MTITILNIAMTVISVVSIIALSVFEIERYKKGEYNPLIFRFREGSEWEVKNLIAYFGAIVPIGIIQNNDLKLFVGFIVMMSSLIFMTILNIICYKVKRDRKIIIQMIIFNSILIVILSVFIYFGKQSIQK